jgi:methyltransferase (TIGR00027 family)
MHDSRPSATAYGVAVLRALHQTVDSPTVFTDPLALRILGQGGAEAVRQRGGNPAASARLRASVVARSRIAEDSVAAHTAPVQYVLLGAGLDSFALRQPAGTGITVFEVDHPATQAWKRRLIAESGLAVPPTLSFVPVDFERDSLAERLAAAGFRFDRPAVFAMLGVLIYLEREAAQHSFRMIAAMPPGQAELVFDYAEPHADAAPPIRAACDAIAARVAAAGEPWRSFFTPPELADMLQSCGFAGCTDWDTTSLKARLFADRTDLLAPGPLTHVVRAWT